MLIFISGSINSGKTTTAKALAERLQAEFLDFDDLCSQVADFQLDRDLHKVVTIGAKALNELEEQQKNVIVSWVLREVDYLQLLEETAIKDKYFVTLAPRLEVAQSYRGRVLNDWERDRVAYHYATAIATPSFGIVIDNSDLSLEEVVDQIVDYISL